jgi:hypothetical protein
MSLLFESLELHSRELLYSYRPGYGVVPEFLGYALEFGRVGKGGRGLVWPKYRRDDSVRSLMNH